MEQLINLLISRNLNINYYGYSLIDSFVFYRFQLLYSENLLFNPGWFQCKLFFFGSVGQKTFEGVILDSFSQFFSHFMDLYC